MHTLLSAGAAIVAGLFLAAAGVLQQREASRRPERGAGALLVHLVRDRLWLLGIGCAVASYGFQAVALAFGPLVLVQPLIVSELLFAVPISVRLRGLRLRARDWAAVGAVVAGLTVGIVAADPRGGQPLAPFQVWLGPLIGVVVLAGGCVLATRVIRGPARASGFALAGALVMGTQSALYAATIALLEHGFWQTFSHWQPYVLIVASIVGALLIQKAFQTGPLAAGTPVIDAVLPLVAIVLGVRVLGEQINTSALGLAGGVAGLALLIAGIVAIDTSPVVRKEQQIERRERDETSEQENTG